MIIVDATQTIITTFFGSQHDDFRRLLRLEKNSLALKILGILINGDRKTFAWRSVSSGFSRYRFLRRSNEAAIHLRAVDSTR